MPTGRPPQKTVIPFTGTWFVLLERINHPLYILFQQKKIIVAAGIEYPMTSRR
jgi:hypothetical protein